MPSRPLQRRRADFAASCVAAVTISTVASVAGSPVGDGVAAVAAPLNSPTNVVADAAGDLFISDDGNNRIREVVKATGAIMTVAGTGTAGYSGDGGPATAARISGPGGLALDAQGNLYFADNGNDRVRKINLATGIITTVAGDGNWTYNGDGQPALAAAIDEPAAVALDQAGDLFIADYGNNRIREVNAVTGLISTVAGDGTSGDTGNGGPATAAEVFEPNYLAVDSPAMSISRIGSTPWSAKSTLPRA